MYFLRFLLLCVLAAALPEALGVARVRVPQNNTITIKQKLIRKKVLLNTKRASLLHLASELQSVFNDINCQKCSNCIEMALKTQRVRSNVLNNQPNTHEYYDIINTIERRKRNTPNEVEKEKIISASVTKYTKESKVFAIEIKGKNKNGLTDTCKLYSVKKSVPCEAMNDLILTKKRRINKRSRISAVISTTENVKAINSLSEKREAYLSHVPESFMPSIEELY